MNWNQETLFNRERFEAWLSVQPDASEWDYAAATGCACCSYIKETSNYDLLCVDPSSVLGKNYSPSVNLPNWMYDLLVLARTITGSHKQIFTASELKRAYAQMFPEQEINVPINQQTSVKTNQTKD